MLTTPTPHPKEIWKLKKAPESFQSQKSKVRKAKFTSSQWLCQPKYGRNHLCKLQFKSQAAHAQTHKTFVAFGPTCVHFQEMTIKQLKSEASGATSLSLSCRQWVTQSDWAMFGDSHTWHTRMVEGHSFCHMPSCCSLPVSHSSSWSSPLDSTLAKVQPGCLDDWLQPLKVWGMRW